MKTKLLAQLIAAQHKWIEQHGGDLPGYVERYGSMHDAQHYGDGGEWVYLADMNALRVLEGKPLLSLQITAILDPNLNRAK